MPTYVYACDRCGEFEQRQSIKDPPLSACPTCGGRVERQIPKGVGVIVKGAPGRRATCDRETPCCGREERCDEPGCGS